VVLSSVTWDQPGLFSCLYRHKRASGLTLVVYCHDASALDRPQLVPPDQLCRLQESCADMVWSATTIVCASESTRATLRRFIATVGLPARPLGVIHPGVDPPASSSTDRPVSLPAVQPGRFTLSVGRLEPGSNHQLLYDVWIRLADEMPDRLIPLLCVGDPGWLAGDLIGTIRDDRRLRQRLLILSGLPDPALGWLYRNCAFTLQPSFAVGWPRPVAESLALGKYCVASTAPANAELSQHLLDLLDPLDFMAWHKEVGRLLADPDYLRAKERRIAAFRPRAWTSAGDELAAEIAACLAARASA
jgi:glycosyltransferase involved in cell wall biosynthesis